MKPSAFFKKTRIDYQRWHDSDDANEITIRDLDNRFIDRKELKGEINARINMNKKERIKCIKNESISLALILMTSITALMLPALIIVDTFNNFLWEGIIMLGWICAFTLYTFVILKTMKNIQELNKLKNKK